MGRLLKTLRELGFPAADGRRGNGAATVHHLESDLERAQLAEAEHQLPERPAALLREYEAWLGEWDDACKRAALGGVDALDTIFAFARLRSSFPFAEDLLDDETVAILSSLPWDAHHRALLGFDLEPAKVRDQAERRIGQACSILSEAALAMAAEGDYQVRLTWLQRIATAHAKQALDALAAALLAPTEQPLLDTSTPQSRHGAAAVLGRLCERARAPAMGPIGSALTQLGPRRDELLAVRPRLVRRPSGELPQIDWLLPLDLSPDPEESEDIDFPAYNTAPPAVGPQEGRPGAALGGRLRELCGAVTEMERWYTSVAAALRAAVPPRPASPPAARAAALGDRRPTQPARARDDHSPQRAAMAVEEIRSRVQLVREALNEAANQLEWAPAGSWVQVVSNAQLLRRRLGPIARGWVENDPGVTPLVRAVTDVIAEVAATTAPPQPSTPEPPLAEWVEPIEPVVAEPVQAGEPIAAAGFEASAPEDLGPPIETWEPPEPQEDEAFDEPDPLLLSELEVDYPVTEPPAEQPEPPTVQPEPEAVVARPKRKRTASKSTAKPRAKRTKRAAKPPEPEEATQPEPTEPALEVGEPAVLAEPDPEPEPQLQPEPEPEPEPGTRPEPTIDWTEQLQKIDAVGKLWSNLPQPKARRGVDPEREQLISRVNELVWPIVGAGIDKHSTEARAIRKTLELIVGDANRFATRQHDIAMLALRGNVNQANTFRARMSLQEALRELESALDVRVPECPGPFKDVREEYDATRNRLMLLRNYISVKL